MATKTVINTNAPSARGISIVIDQDQATQQHHQQLIVNCQQETLRSSQKAENGKITIYQNTVTTRTQMAPTPSTAITRTVVTKLQPQPSKLVASTKTATTRIGVNHGHNYPYNERNNDDVAGSNEDPNDERAFRRSFTIQSGEFGNDQKTSYTTSKHTIVTSTAVPTFPHLLLKVANERGKSSNEHSSSAGNSEEMVETNGNEDNLVRAGISVGKLQVNRNVAVAANVAEATGVASVNSQNGQSTDISTSATTNTKTTIKPTVNGQTNQHGMMIIQCNVDDEHHHDNNEERDEAAHDRHTNNYDHHDHVGSLVVAATASAPSNINHNESCVTSVVENGQNAFERICTNGLSGSERDRHEAGNSLCNTDVQQQLESTDVNANANAIVANSPTTATAKATKADCASALTVTDAVRRRSDDQTNANSTQTLTQNQIEATQSQLHVLKIQIKPEKVNEQNEKQVTVVTLKEAQVQEKQKQQPKTSQTKELNRIAPVHITEILEEQSARPQPTGESAYDLHLNSEKMVQKPTTAMSVTATPMTGALASSTILNSGAVTVSGGNANTNLNLNTGAIINGNANSNGTNNGHANNTITSGNTTVTELNVSNPSYLYYVMSSGQFSPCDTLDSGTGSDLESNGNITPGTPSPQSKLQCTLDKLKAAAQSSSQNSTNGSSAPKMELHMKATKIRLNGSAKKSALGSSSSATKSHTNGDHARAGSFTDSEESESSSLSCDSLHSTEFIRQSSVSPTTQKTCGNTASAAHVKMLGAFLPDSLLRDIRDRKFPTNDFEAKYGDGGSVGSADGGSEGDGDGDVTTTPLPDVINEQDYIRVDHAKFLKEHNSNNIAVNNSHNNKRLSLPNKTFVLNADNGTFVDVKMNSMPRKYEADKYYNFHVKEHENFRSFDIGAAANLGGGDLESFSEYETKSLHDDAFAGYKDIRCGSATSTIRSSKGTVRGVKNRVRNGIATFLQMQQPNVKNFKEKDAGKVVLYTTSMGIIRDTYAKCANVKQILRTLLVKFEERDVFMSIEYQQEIKERMHSETIKVPQLFVEGQHIGDADTVERLNESGELRQLLKPYKSIATTFTCQTCGGYRLLPCPSCNGSKKSVHRNHFTAEFVALKCMNCDEVGLVKCHNC
ncbi:probable serine/threonine-protein kinase DDB_G0282963 [Anastrepha ludens]|uniref:probable serine/threonine-protein kinase DDB_G0282963 n=1 Tax=Anastrepha ludens TaxID=28586 RepID=UPI0023B13F29|nr:probable serine/threonine-protein kinase DDB_G0282963 [Anastrepha ludens]